MAFTYLILNCIFIACIVFLFVKTFTRPSKTWWMTLLILLVLTLIFDNLAIWANFFHYTPEKILGIYIIQAPIEDFFYALLAVIIIPVLWRHFKTVGEEKTTQ